ncbi:hypothetical protein [Hymenobacter terrenus]|uniref:hypothetical protein n=1 Tax=Hymenobacter terrenus TaxID=1629124 RepID=UPI0018CE2D64|nr:hypothetical protein [Hymenobacter terrenus]
MKRNCNPSVMLLMLLLFIGIQTTGFAQSKADAVIMLNGTKKEGKVIAILANTVKFKHAGENLEYELKRDEISRIQFASGRVETINEAPATAASPSSPVSRSTSNPADRKNKIAVLPFQFVSNELGFQPGPMSKQLQADCAKSLIKNTSNVIVQDPLTTNRLLAKGNIDLNNAADVDPEALAVVLGVEYVVFGSVNVLNEGSLSSGGAVTTYKDKEKQKRDKNNRDTKASGTVVTGNSAVTTTNYDTKVELTIYTDQGSTYYSKSKNAFGSGADSYSSSLNYLIKRTPFGTKSR